MGLDGALRGGESGGLVVGDAAVRDMMDVERELEPWSRRSGHGENVTVHSSTNRSASHPLG
jgi:hypothetical protein